MFNEERPRHTHTHTHKRIAHFAYRNVKMTRKNYKAKQKMTQNAHFTENSLKQVIVVA